jgi:hypothetical protein
MSSQKRDLYECTCGMQVHVPYTVSKHRQHHERWEQGYPVPPSLHDLPAVRHVCAVSALMREWQLAYNALYLGISFAVFA